MGQRSPLPALLERISRRDFVVAVVGLGYVGLPLAIASVRAGFTTIGLDTDQHKVDKLNLGQTYLGHIDVSELGTARARGRFAATSDARRLREADAVLICVPTPVDAHQQPDLHFVAETARSIAEQLRPSQLVVLESTTYPGTTDELVRDLLEASGLSARQDFYLAYSPEREDPGNPRYRTSSIPKLVGGTDADSGQLTEALYASIFSDVVRVSSARVAEAAKLTENVFRAVNIALVNELKVIFDRMGIDIWEVLDAAATKPFGYMRFDPGPGWGGHCIPVDPFYLAWKARQFGTSAKFIELAGEINIRMHEYVVSKLVDELNRRGRALAGARVLLLGVAYKKNIDGCRESPAFPIMHQLEDRGATVTFHDPHVPSIPPLREWPGFVGRSSVPLSAELVAAQDAVLIVTDHDGIDYAWLLEHARLVVDSRGVLRAKHANLVKA